MPSARSVALLQELVNRYGALKAESGGVGWSGEWKLLAVILLLLLDANEASHSPRVSYQASDFAGASFWKSLRTSVSQRDGALMQFLGVPWFLFRKLVSAMQGLLPRRYAVARGSGPERGRGRPCTFDAMDITALALRRYQTQGGQEGLQIDFGMSRSGISRYLSLALTTFDAVIAVFPGSEIRYPTWEEAEMQWAGVVAQFGPPPCTLSARVALTIDGTVTPVRKSTNSEVQAQYYSGHKGDGTNNILVKDMWGLVADYVIGAPGVCHDAGLSENLFKRHASVVTNPHKFAMLADSGFKGWCTNGAGGGAAVYRPLTKENVETQHLKSFEAWSKWVTSVRQVDEWGQAALKRSFPYFCNVVRVQDLREHIKHQRAIMHLSNLRTRAVGYNQLTTTFKRHVDAHYAEQLDLGRGGEDGLKRYMAIAKARYEAGPEEYGL